MAALLCALPSTCNVYVPGLTERATPAKAYQQWQASLERKDNSCPRKLPFSSCMFLSARGGVTRKITGDPFTSLVGSHCAAQSCAVPARATRTLLVAACCARA